jgi:multicomponent Na+:H+ antiporter subunit E
LPPLSLGPPVRSGVALALFAGTWLLWSGHFSPLLLVLGALSCVLVLWLAHRTGFFAADVYALHLGPRLPSFWFWLSQEIARSNLTVARIVLGRTLRIDPVIVSVDAAHLPAAIQATLANAITLTPGTVAMDIHRGVIEVHCLTQQIAADLRSGEMLRRAERLAGGDR